MSDWYDGCDWKNTTEYDYEPVFDDPESYSLEDQVGDVLDRVEEQAEAFGFEPDSLTTGDAVSPLSEGERDEHEGRVRRFLQEATTTGTRERS
jgi:hypothetical protein